MNAPVDIPGTIGTFDDSSDLMPAEIVAGTNTNSCFLHFDTDMGVRRFYHRRPCGSVDPQMQICLMDEFRQSLSDGELPLVRALELLALSSFVRMPTIKPSE